LAFNGNSEDFWREHCFAVPLARETTEESAGKKAQTCGRCKTLKHPGGVNGGLNHKRDFCSDGVRITLKVRSDTLPVFPQPEGIFTR
ncbi:hypothetical protein BC835DRAFT_1300937, partial [Cytidiella melzeri]